jgi:hypothetical protein
MAKDKAVQPESVDAEMDAIETAPVAAPVKEEKKVEAKVSKSGTFRIVSGVLKSNKVGVSGGFNIEFDKDGFAQVSEAEWQALVPCAEAFKLERK